MKPKHFLLALLFMVCYGAKAQNRNTTVNLIWKINPTDTIRYKTVMDAKSTPADTTSTFAKMAKGLTEMNNSNAYTTALTVNKKNANLINIVMYSGNGKTDETQQGANFEQLINKMKEGDNARKKDKKKKSGKKEKKKKRTDKALEEEETLKQEDSLMTKDLFKGLNSVLNNTVVLRGCITKEGVIAGNYYKTSQTNLIALLFELPGNPIKVGETWHTRIQLVQMDQNFVADSVAEVNKAYIEKIEEVNGNSIAVIKYEASSYVSGDFNNPMGSMLGINDGNNNKIFMSISHQATARFNITTGRLESYDGLMKNASDAWPMGGESETVFKLIPY